jgi:hypothetical protein
MKDTREPWIKNLLRNTDFGLINLFSYNNIYLYYVPIPLACTSLKYEWHAGADL